MAILVVLAFLVIAALEVPGLVKKRMWRELAVFLVLLLFGMALSIPQALGLPVPSPNDPVEIILKPFAGWLTPK